MTLNRNITKWRGKGLSSHRLIFICCIICAGMCPALYIWFKTTNKHIFKGRPLVGILKRLLYLRTYFSDISYLEGSLKRFSSTVGLTGPGTVLP
jgi:hypothetical protein